jgi:hypothetical protein
MSYKFITIQKSLPQIYEHKYLKHTKFPWVVSSFIETPQEVNAKREIKILSQANIKLYSTINVTTKPPTFSFWKQVINILQIWVMTVATDIMR